MTVPGNLSSPLLATAAADAAAAAVATKSLRFNSADTAYLARTPSSAGNRKTWTWAAWIKRGAISSSSEFVLFGMEDDVLLALAQDKLRANVIATQVALTTSQIFRDPSAWYHVVFAIDTTASTANNRVRIYVNGSEITDFETRNNPSQNADTNYNKASIHYIGRQRGQDPRYFAGYLADIYFIDGSALDATSFGAYDDNGVWQAAAYSGTYGTNGFHLLDFANESTVGHDSSGNNNDFTANNFTESVVVPNKGFDVVTYTGNYGTQSVTGLSFQPDFIWLKDLSTSNDHNLYDVVRGANKKIVSNSTAAESTVTNVLNSFDASGFSIGDSGQINSNGNSYVAWCWKAGGAAVSNTDGTITSSVSANNTYGFSIIKHTGTNAAGTFGHGLNSAPKFMIFKNLEATDNWFVWHTSFGSATTGAVLNSTNDYFTNGTNELNSTVPTASVIHVGSNLATNGNNQEVITYAWSEVAGFSKFGSYTGNGSSSGPSVTGLGFKPRWILIKGDLDGEDWVIVDTVRSPTNPNKKLVAPNSSAQEFTHPGSAYDMDIDDDGFTVKNDNPRWNTNNKTYIWAAFGSGSGSPEDLDVLFDVPANGTQTDSGAGGEVSGNYATLNPLNKHASSDTFSNGNLQASWSGGSACIQPSTIAFSSGKYYYEFSPGISGSIGNGVVGIRRSDSRNHSNTFAYLGNGQKMQNESASNYGSSYTDGDVIGVAVDMDAGTIRFYKNGADQGQAYSGISGTYTFYQGTFGGSNGGGYAVNFGQRPFAHSAPSGFKALCTTNLPTPAIADGSDYFDTKLYTTETTISGLSFSPDWVWLKRRSQAADNGVYDTVRGVNKLLYPNATNSEETGGGVTAFNSDGFDLGTNALFKGGGHSFVSWNWDAGSSTTTNTTGGTSASVRANPTAGFSIVAWSGHGSGSTTVGHGLSAAPELIILKGRSNSGAWVVGSDYLGWGNRLELNTTSAKGSASADFNSTAPTSSVFTVGSNQGTGDKVAYCISPVAGYSAVGSYDGNGSTDGRFIHTGFRVAYLILKCHTTTELWMVHDNARDPDNVVSKLLQPHTNDAEIDSVSNYGVDFLSNGFKFRSSSNRNNGSGQSYLYYAVAENPFQANGGLAR